MLTKLSIRNYAIIESSEISFESGFNIITGETGAGKSILLGALSLILGQRADTNSILNPEKKSVIEGHFSIDTKTFKAFFLENDLDLEELTIIRRELLPTGKSRAFINDSPVTLETLRALTSQLVDLHQQHESLSIMEIEFQRSVVDIFSAQTKEVENFSKIYSAFKKDEILLAKKLEDEANNAKEKDFLEYQFQELETATIRSGELQEIEEELHAALHFEEISETIQSIFSKLQDEESGGVSILKQCLADLRQLSKLNSKFETLDERFNSALIEIEDIFHDLISYNSDAEIDEERMAELTSRSDVLNRLLKKHQLNTGDELLDLQTRLQEQLNSFESVSDEISQLQKNLKKQEEILHQKADIISEKRNSVKNKLENRLKDLLTKVGMPKAELNIQIEKKKDLHAFGKDEIQFLFSANAGQSLKQLKQVASGGELSRLMLAIKTMIADKTILPTLIFDEIDTGISGETAKKIGDLLKNLSHYHQIISVTHLPQIAAKGNHHLKVEKKEQSGVVLSQVVPLSTDERIIEIAEMLSGANPSEMSISTARELLN